LQEAGPNDPDRFRRLFDAALLLGEEDQACVALRDTPTISPSFPARIFCLARSGDWPAAALSFSTARSLGQIDPQIEPLLERFLDPELAEESDDLAAPRHPTPLVFRLMEAIGQPLVDHDAAGGLFAGRSARQYRLEDPYRSRREAGTDGRHRPQPAARALYRNRGRRLGRGLEPGRGGGRAGCGSHCALG